MDIRTNHHRARWGLVLSLVCALMLGAGPAPAAEVSAKKKAQAKAHYVKAKAAFEKDQYQQALFEYTKAYAILPLPGFLFNIGQCYRNMGYTAEAIEAFELFLEKKPDAPNRKAVEELIAQLNKASGQQPTVDVEPGDSDTTDPGTKPGDSSGDGTTGDPNGGTSGTADEPVSGDSDGSDTGTSGQDDDGKTPAFVDTAPPPTKPKKPEKTPIYKKWWFWTIVGAAAVGGGAAGIYLGTRSTGPDIPDSTLGVVDFSQ